mgnify:CR=1 FL=1
MAWWTDLIKIAVPAVVDMFSGKDQPAQSDQTKDDQGNLVAKPIPGKLPERERYWAAIYSDAKRRSEIR